MNADGTCKIDHVVDRYDLTVPGEGPGSVDRYLVDRWTGDGDVPAAGYKQLTEWFNKRLMKQVYERHGRDTIRTRIDGEYEALREEDGLLRDEVVEDLRADGIDPDALAGDMVSWSTMRRHLKECLGAEKSSPEASTEWELESLDIARSRMVEKALSSLRSLASKRELPDADRAEVEVQVKLSCPECHTRIPLEDAVERGYVCREHVGGEERRGSTLPDATGALLPLGLLPSVVLDLLLSEGGTSTLELLMTAPL